jgi:hypothetical protein
MTAAVWARFSSSPRPARIRVARACAMISALRSRKLMGLTMPDNATL